MTRVNKTPDWFRRRPFRAVTLILVAVIAFILVREFAGGFLDGLVAGFTDDR